MESSIAIGLAAVLVSVAALILTTALTVRQVRLLRQSNYIPLVVDLICQYRSRELYDDLVYVSNKLQIEHDPATALSDLPPEVRSAILNVAYYYQSFAWLIHFDIMRDELSALSRPRIISAWEAVRPYIAAERNRYPGPLLVMLEHTYRDMTDSAAPGRTSSSVRDLFRDF